MIENLKEQILTLTCNQLHAGSPFEDVRQSYGRGFEAAKQQIYELLKDLEKEVSSTTLQQAGQLIVKAVADNLDLWMLPWIRNGDNWVICRLREGGSDDIVVGVSDGGIISVNGSPFTPDTRELNDSYYRAMKSVTKWVKK